MAIFGKIFGGVFGALVYGPLGFIVGVGVGHLFDKGIELNTQLGGTEVTLAKKVFFKTTFMVMGYIAKADGRVSEKEIQIAREAMAHLQLTQDQIMSAIQFFNMGKSPQFNFNSVMDNFVRHCGHHPQLVQLFVELQIQSALVEGVPNYRKRQVLELLCEKLNISESLISQMEAHSHADTSSQYRRTEQSNSTRSSDNELAYSYKLLDINQTATDQQLKRAYRKLMSQHHPDKLVSKGLPEEMIKIATEKAQRIQLAYDLICKSRGIK